MKLKERKNISFFKVKLLFFLVFLVSFFLLITSITKNVSSYFMNYAVSKTEKLINQIINNVVISYDSLDYNKLYKITKNYNNEIEMIDYDPITVNEFLDELTSLLEQDLLKIEQSTLFKMPIGSITKNPLFNNIGPNIPVKLEFISSVSTNIKTNVKEYGINNSLVEVVIFIEVKTKIVLPLISKDIIVTNEIPLSYKLIMGKIPNYYGTSYSKNSNLYETTLDSNT